jgi:hypothetical protein
MQSKQQVERGSPYRYFAKSTESSLASIPEVRSNSSHHDLAKRHILLQQRRAMQEVIDRLGNSSITDSSFPERESSDYSAETNDRSRNIPDHFNWSSSILPQDPPTKTTPTNSLRSVKSKGISLRTFFSAQTKESSSNCIFDHFSWSSSSQPQETATTTILPQETPATTTPTNSLRPVLQKAQPQETATTTILPQETPATTTQTNSLRPVLRKNISLRNFFAVQTKESSRNIFDHFNWSSSLLPQKTSTTTTQNNNLKSVLPRDLIESDTSPSEEDQSKASRRSNQRNKRNKRSSKLRGERSRTSPTRSRSHKKMLMR